MSLTDYSGTNLKVVVNRPWYRLVVAMALLSVLMLTLIGGYFLGRELQVLDRGYVASLENINESNNRRLAQLNRQLIDVRLAYDVDSQALQALRSDLEAARSRLAKLDEEVNFYRSLMAPGSVAKGLQIAGFEVQSLSDGTRSYHLLLTQIATRRSWLAGEVTIDVAGESASGPQVLPLTDLAQVEEYPLKFRFRYFQDLRGSIDVPDGFTPREVVVTVSREGNKPVSRSFPWTADV